MKQPQSPIEALERRRFKGIDLIRQGYQQTEVARILSVTGSAVCQWVGTYRKKGRRGLKGRKPPGRPPKLNASQKQKLLKLLAKGAMTFGYPNDLWTTQRIADLIKERFKVSYDRDHIGPLLRQCGWSYQRPTQKAQERNEQAIQTWLKKTWPRIKKKPAP